MIVLVFAGAFIAWVVFDDWRQARKDKKGR